MYKRQVQQGLAGRREGDLAGGAHQQRDAELPLQLLDRPGERGLGHAEALGGAAEVQLLGDGDEVPELAYLHVTHTATVSIAPGSVLHARRAQRLTDEQVTRTGKLGLIVMIVVTAPTSNIGSQLLARLVDGGAEVRVIAREPSRIRAELRERVEVVEGSHGDAEVVDAAFDGAESVFWLAPPNPRADDLRSVYLDFLEPALAALAKRGVARVVGVSALGRGTPMAGNAGHVTCSLEMDDRIAASGVAYRALTMPSFMDNMLRQAGALRNGMFFSPLPGDLKVPMCATRDIAAVAARELLDASWTGFEEVPVLGPEDLSNDDQARILTEVLGRPVRFQHVPVDAFRENLLANGMSESVARGMVEMMLAKAAGLDNAEPRTARTTTPTTFRTWCEEVLVPALG